VPARLVFKNNFEFATSLETTILPYPEFYSTGLIKAKIYLLMLLYDYSNNAHVLGHKICLPLWCVRSTTKPSAWFWLLIYSPSKNISVHWNPSSCVSWICMPISCFPMFLGTRTKIAIIRKSWEAFLSGFWQASDRSLQVLDGTHGSIIFYRWKWIRNFRKAIHARFHFHDAPIPFFASVQQHRNMDDVSILISSDRLEIDEGRLE